MDDERRSEGFIATGGSWGDPLYTFAQFGGRPGLFSSNKLGFRLVRDSPEGGDQGSERIDIDREIPKFAPTSVATLQKRAAKYPFERARGAPAPRSA